jgi:hypothetical protein
MPSVSWYAYLGSEISKGSMPALALCAISVALHSAPQLILVLKARREDIPKVARALFMR